jgi:hypothetical protein
VNPRSPSKPLTFIKIISRTGEEITGFFARIASQMNSLSKNPRKASIVPGDPRAGNRFPESVRTLMEETNPSVSAQPGNSREFQAHAELLPLRPKAARRVFNAPALRAERRNAIIAA